MTVQELIQSLTPEIYMNMKRSLELGRWPDGRSLNKEQKALCMEALLHYEVEHNVPEQERIGYMEGGCKSKNDDDTQPLTIK